MITLTKDAVHAVNKMVGKREGYGLRVSKMDSCCSGLQLDISFGRKTAEDMIIKTHKSLKLFADRETLLAMDYMKKNNLMKQATIHHAKTSHGPKFLTEHGRIRLNIWEHDLE